MRRFLTLLVTLLVFGAGSALGQVKQVSGVVTSADDKQPIPGASVFVKEAPTVGTTTDINGKYILKNVPSNAKTIVFRFVGYTTLELPVKAELNAVMQSETQKIDEVMVVAYGTTKKSTFTGSAQVVKSDKLTNAKVESVDKALAGKVAGVRVSSTTGEPGASGELQIRGIGSINGSTSPLYVVDGVPMNSGQFGSLSSNNVLSTLNAEDIESMTVLKDAAAASLYGSRAANGVVIITTKKGKSGETKINAKASFGISNMATNSYEMMSGPGYVEFTKIALKNYYLYDVNGLLPGSPNYGNATELANANAFAEDYYISEGQIQDTKQNTNWRDEIYKTGYNQDYQVSITGGNEKNLSYVGLGYNKVDGTIKSYGFEKFTATMNYNNATKDWLALDFKTNLAYTKQKGRRDQSDQSQGIGTASPLGILFSMNPTAVPYINGKPNTNASLDSKVKHPDLALGTSQSFVQGDTYKALMQGGGTISFTDYLKFKSINAMDLVNFKQFEYWGPNSIDGASMNGLGNKNDYLSTTFTSSNQILFNKNIGDHSVDAVFAYEIQDVKLKTVVTQAKDYSTDKLPELAVGKPDVASSYSDRNFMQSFLGSVNYNFKNKYYLAASLRSDESSKLGKDKRQASFWSASASWRFTQEDFLSNNSILTDGKIRASIGTNGNLPGSNYAHLGLYNFGGLYGSEAAIWLSQPENKDLGWEKSRNFNIGLELAFFKKYSLTVEYYDKYTKDLLMSVPTSYITGFSSSLQNNGEISNKGFEVELNARNLLNSKFIWDMGFNLTSLKAKVEKLPNHEDVIQGDGNLYMYREGQDLYSFWLPKWNGVDPQTGFATFLIDPTKPATANNLTYKYSSAQRGIQGKAYPDIAGGFSNTFSYKGFTLSTLITYQFGGNLFDYPGYFSAHGGVRLGSFTPSKEYEDNYWKQAGDNAKYPKPVAYWGYRPDRWSSLHLLSSDFIRFKEVSLSYNFPERIAKKLGLTGLQASFTGNNLFFVYRATDFLDPEVPLNGYRTVDTPISRVYSFGINLNF